MNLVKKNTKYLIKTLIEVVGDILPGGLADEKTPRDFDPILLEMGIKIELEHTEDKNLAREIAMDHLVEDPNYYQKLKQIEAYKEPPEVYKMPDEHGAPRQIETLRTYRIQHKGTYSLFKVDSVSGDTVSMTDISTGVRKTMNKGEFMNKLEKGSIYVSSSIVEFL